MAIIILAFVPVFALTGQEGKLFHPLAFTKTFAMIGSTLLAVTIVPVLSHLLVRGPFHPEERNWVMRVARRIYEPVLDWALRHRAATLLAAGGAFLLPAAGRRRGLLLAPLKLPFLAATAAGSDGARRIADRWRAASSGSTPISPRASAGSSCHRSTRGR